MNINTDTLKKYLLPNLPYLLFVLVFANLGEAVRLAPGADAPAKFLGLSDGFSMAFQSLWPGAAVDWLPKGSSRNREAEAKSWKQRPAGELGLCSMVNVSKSLLNVVSGNQATGDMIMHDWTQA